MMQYELDVFQRKNAKLAKILILGTLYKALAFMLSKIQ